MKSAGLPVRVILTVALPVVASVVTWLLPVPPMSPGSLAEPWVNPVTSVPGGGMGDVRPRRAGQLRAHVVAQLVHQFIEQQQRIVPGRTGSRKGPIGEVTGRIDRHRTLGAQLQIQAEVAFEPLPLPSPIAPPPATFLTLSRRPWH